MLKKIIVMLVLGMFCNPAFVLSAKKSDFGGYLFAYFEGSGDRDTQEQLRYAVSLDGFNWTALNNNMPIVASKDISQTGGVRDPFILRKAKNDGYYMVATDMYTMKNGWDHNPGIIMMKSDNLTEWESSIIDLEALYPKKFANVKWVWAPQVFYDAKKKKYLVYFTVRYKDDEKLDFYAAYANKNFTGFEKTPRLMFSPKYGGIDGDIIYKDGLYHFYYKGNTKDENGKEYINGIQQATSKSLKGPWKEEFKYLDAYAGTRVRVEGSSIFKLNNTDEYILMYDLYSSGRFEFQRSKDLFHFTDTAESFTKDFDPRHGSVISITKDEARGLHEKWSGVPASLLQPQEKGDAFHFKNEGNPLIKHHFTADPAAFVEGDTLWLYTGHDFTGGQKRYKMKDWLVFSTTDMQNWTEHPVPMKASDFAWAKSGAAWAGHVAKRNGKYYWYISTNWSGIGVGVSDKPEGPFVDALGKPLLTTKECFDSKHSWACIDPAIYTDDDGTPWIFWGNRECYYAKLKENMIEIDGEIKRINFEGLSFTEAPWIHKRKGKYYLTYATEFPEKIAYAMANSIEGPWEYKGILNEIAGNSNTNHQSVVEFKDQWYFVYHNGGINTNGSSYSRSVCIDKMEYESDGSIKRIIMTTEGVSQK